MIPYFNSDFQVEQKQNNFDLKNASDELVHHHNMTLERIEQMKAITNATLLNAEASFQASERIIDDSLASLTAMNGMQNQGFFPRG